ncbi:MAG TPA: alanine/glycine:cation symporter family protein [Candidatus Methanomethylophilaceae archaeon]|nr:alanine/glycine:cation symporter family protein [Candidatus Methanomethylophilaceae archaeon]
MTSTENLQGIIDIVNDNIWYIAFILIIGGGVYLTYKLKGVQITHFIESIKLALFGGNKAGIKGVTSSEAFWVGVGARIGIGNIAGVAIAILLGGAGAIFWIWVFAFIGGATCFAECTLGQIFKEKKADGLYHGGPAYYIRDGLNSPKLASFISLLLIVTYSVGFIGIQANSANSAFITAFNFEGNSLFFAIILSAIAALIMYRGIKGVAKISAKMVPAMSALWFLVIIITIAFNWNFMGNAIVMIFQGAFGMDSILGGTLGAAILWGLRRGVFSNEAGIGSVPNVSSAADVGHPVEQGLIQSFGVFLDTLICTGTAFVILTASHTIGQFAGQEAGVPLVAAALETGPLGEYAAAVLAVLVFSFVLASIVSSFSLSDANVKFLSVKPIYSTLLKATIIITIFVASLAPADLIWSLADVFMAILGICNIVVVLLMRDYIIESFKDYNKQRLQNKEPVFLADDLPLDISGITVWGDRSEVELDVEANPAADAG